jgi:hypothetical protein
MGLELIFLGLDCETSVIFGGMNLLRGWDEFLHSLASVSPLRNNRNTHCNVRNKQNRF